MDAFALFKPVDPPAHVLTQRAGSIHPQIDSPRTARWGCISAMTESAQFSWSEPARTTEERSGVSGSTLTIASH